MMKQFIIFLQENYQELIPWCITLIAMLLTFYSSIKSNSISRLAINKTILSKNREDWIRNFKDDISNLIVLLAIEKTESDFDGIRQNFKERLFLINKIMLSLNHNDPSSTSLLTSLMSLNKEDVENMSELSADVMKTSIKLIEQEWAKVDSLV